MRLVGAPQKLSRSLLCSHKLSEHWERMRLIGVPQKLSRSLLCSHKLG